MAKFNKENNIEIDLMRSVVQKELGVLNSELMERLQEKYSLNDIAKEEMELSNKGYLNPGIIVEEDNGKFDEFDLGSITIKGKKYFNSEISDILDRRDFMRLHSKYPVNKVKPKLNQGFYILPFNKDCEDTMEAIKVTLKEKKIACDLIKSQDIFHPEGNGDIIENIWRDLLESRFIVADLSYKNPNVYYELGIAEAAGKKIILICSEQSFKQDYGSRYPFDVSTQYIFRFNKQQAVPFKEICTQIADRIQTLIDIKQK